MTALYQTSYESLSPQHPSPCDRVLLHTFAKQMHQSPQAPSIQMLLYSREDLDRQTKIYNLEIIKFQRNGESLGKISQLFLGAYSHNSKSIKVNSTGAQRQTH